MLERIKTMMSAAETPESLYHKYGGEGTIKTLVEDFYRRILDDGDLAPIFAGVDLGRLKRHQALFISQALGGPKAYDGRELSAAHGELGITDAQFDKVAGHLQEAMAGLGVAEEDIGEIIALVGSLRGQVVTANGHGEGVTLPFPPEAEAEAEAEAPEAAEPEEVVELSDPVQEDPAPAGASLYDKLGGGPTIKAVVEEFYKRVLGDARLAPVFQGVDLGALKRHQALFISQALGGPKEYDGRSMYEAHKELMIDDGQFDRVAGHLVGTLKHFQVGQGDIDTIVGAIAPLKAEIVADPFKRWLRAG